MSNTLNPLLSQITHKNIKKEINLYLFFIDNTGAFLYIRVTFFDRLFPLFL